MRFPLLAAIVASVAALSSPAAAQQFDASESDDGLFGIFDEVRLGGSFTVQSSSPDELMINGQLFFTSFVPPFENYFLNTFLRPRPHLWTTIATDEGTNQLSGGLTWNFPLFDPFFIEASFGGTLHDGPLDNQPGGERLGCHVMFRESIGLGADIGEHWRAVVLADHSSHASLCDGSNGGLTYVGLYAGYRF
jgi:lipid A 3-O-deacylase